MGIDRNMLERSHDVFDLFERRLAVLGQLANSLTTPGTGSPGATLLFVEQRADKQRELLKNWAGVEAELEPWRLQSPDLFSGFGESCALPLETQARWLGYSEQYQRVLTEIQKRCRVEMALLRRSRRTAAAFSSLLYGPDSTYAPLLPGSAMTRRTASGDTAPAGK